MLIFHDLDPHPLSRAEVEERLKLYRYPTPHNLMACYRMNFTLFQYLSKATDKCNKVEAPKHPSSIQNEATP